MTKGQEIVQGFKSWQDCTGMAQAIDAALTERTKACCGAAMDCRDFQRGAYSGMAQDIAWRIWAVDRPPPPEWCPHWRKDEESGGIWFETQGEAWHFRAGYCEPRFAPCCGQPRPT